MLFRSCVYRGTANLLVFEDDVEFVCDPNPTMEEVVKQIPSNYKILYLGSQCTRQFESQFSENLIPVQGAFATHACAYSLRCMKDMVGKMVAPIDNWIVSDIQNGGDCYQTNPLLATQRESYSDIGKRMMNWQPFILLAMLTRIYFFKLERSFFCSARTFFRS